MMIKTNLKNLFCFVTLSSVSAIAFAAPTITFDGEVSDQTCSLNFNGGGASYVLVNPVKSSDFGASPQVGATAGATDFTVSASGCTATGGTKTVDVKIKLLGHNVDLSSGILGNSASGTNAATGVGFQLFNNNSPIVLKAIPTAVVLGQLNNTTTASDTLTQTFTVKYYATQSTISEGKVQGVLEYALSYF